MNGMNYENRSFSVPAPASVEYRDNYERTFGGKNKPPAPRTVRVKLPVVGECSMTEEELHRAVVACEYALDEFDR